MAVFGVSAVSLSRNAHLKIGLDQLHLVSATGYVWCVCSKSVQECSSEDRLRSAAFGVCNWLCLVCLQ